MKKYILLIAIFVISVSGFANAELIGYWSFDGNALDGVAGGHDGIAVGDPEFVDGVMGQGVCFDGDDSFILENSEDFASGAGGFSVSFWYKLNTNLNKVMNWSAFISKYGESSKGWQVRRGNWNPVPEFLIRATTGYDYMVGETNIYDQQWHHIACVYDGAERKLYVDGVLENSYADTGDPGATTALVVIGAKCPENSTSPYRNVTGCMDEVRLYDNPLTEAEVTALGNADKALRPNPFDGETEADFKTALSWAGTAQQYDVYLSTDASDLAIASPAANVKVGTFSATEISNATLGNLKYDTTYYWRVDEVNGGTVTGQGDVWSFTTGDFTGESAPVLPVTDGLIFQLDSEHVQLATDTAGVKYVAKMYDRSGSGNDAAPLRGVTSLYCPKYLEDACVVGQRSYPSVSFDGLKNYLEIASNNESFNSKNYSWFIVMKADPEIGGRLFSAGFEGGAEHGSSTMFGNRVTAHSDSSNSIRMWGRNTRSEYIVTEDKKYALSGEWQIIESHWDYDNYGVGAIAVDGSSLTKQSGMNAIPFGNHCEVEIAGEFPSEWLEFIMFNRCLSTPEREAIGSYLKQKYAIASGYDDVDPATLTSCEGKWSYQLGTAVQYEDVDFDRNCKIDMEDFSELAKRWMANE